MLSKAPSCGCDERRRHKRWCGLCGRRCRKALPELGTANQDVWCGGFRVDAAGNCIEGTSTWKKPEREDDWKAYIDPGTGFKFSHRRPRAAVRALDAARSPACLRCCRRPQAAAAMSGAATNDGADCADDVVLRPCRSWGRQSTTCGAAASSSAAGGQGRPCAPSTRRRLCAPSTRRSRARRRGAAAGRRLEGRTRTARSERMTRPAESFVCVCVCRSGGFALFRKGGATSVMVKMHEAANSNSKGQIRKGQGL